VRKLPAKESCHGLDADVLELRPHGPASVELQGKYAFAESRIRAVREIENQPVVEIVPNVSALRDDHHVVPIVELEELLEAGLLRVEIVSLGNRRYTNPENALAHRSEGIMVSC